MKSSEIRKKFFEFFESKDHKIVDSAPIVLKNDPTLMFTNAGMNQFKDFFLGTKKPEIRRVADTQKCLRASGKHNDLEEVGYDSYHHTMFEMLGNWSFGDYFKKEAISWAWELLTDVYGLPKDRLYITVFGGDENEGLGQDQEAAELWLNHVDKDKVLYFGKKDNFWEMGDTGPCGPCSEIHIDLRPNDQRSEKAGADLVNMDHPLVVEIWNLVFIQFNRKANGSLEDLPEKHIDTGMGFERLCMAMQSKLSNYDTDVFTPYLEFIQKESGIEYKGSYDPNDKTDVSMRVMTDHLRAVAFSISDGELPGNTGAGYVIRRILRRAIRYYYSFLNIKEPFIHKMVPLLADQFESVFPELKAQFGFVQKVILEEEKSFLRTLEGGLKRIENVELKDDMLDGQTAFELYDTYGFPIDLTRLIAEEKNWQIDEKGFETALNEQRERARADAKRETGDWEIVMEIDNVEFLGYDQTDSTNLKVSRYRTSKKKDKLVYQLVLDKTPFYAEGGGQVGDTGSLDFDGEIVRVIDTIRENDLIIHIVDKIPSNVASTAEGKVDYERRALIENNHTATHLMHAALRQVLGTHVQQKGSLVKDNLLRFDFSHFQKMTEEEIAKVESLVNKKIRENIRLDEQRSLPIEDAKDAGAMMLFGEKYGDFVRMITFDPDYSRELCGGCHVNATGEIGLFKIITETAIAAGTRRIEAVTAEGADEFLKTELNELNEVRSLFKNATQLVQNVAGLQNENKELKKQLDQLMVQAANSIQKDLINEVEEINGLKTIIKEVSIADMNAAKTLAHNIEKELGEAVICFGINQGEKANLLLLISQSLVDSKSLNAGQLIKAISRHIQGGGGGQAFYASAGGKNPAGLSEAFTALRSLLND